jgi:hypothetical protein
MDRVPAALVTCALTAFTATVVAVQPASREIIVRPTVPISTLLRPGDTRVVIDYGSPPLRAFIPSFIPVGELLAGNALDADVVAVVRIEVRSPRLTPDGTWIVTRVGARIVEAFKPHTLRKGDLLEFEQDGGALNLDGIEIECEAEWETDFSVGQEYLLFVSGSEATATVKWSYRITPRRTLESQFPGFLQEDETDTGDGLPLSDARRYLRKLR